MPLFTGDLEEEASQFGELLSGRSGAAMLEILIKERDLEKIALYWAKGAQIPWPALHREEGGRMMRLPTYPFARERYWISSNDKGPSHLLPERSREEAVPADADAGISIRHRLKTISDNGPVARTWHPCGSDPFPWELS